MARLQPARTLTMPQPPPKAKEPFPLSVKEVFAVILGVMITAGGYLYWHSAADETCKSPPPAPQEQLAKKVEKPPVYSEVPRDKTKVTPLNPQVISASYTRKAQSAFNQCADSGLLDVIQSVSTYLGRSPQERNATFYRLLSLGCFESGLRLGEGVSPDGYGGTFQFGAPEFIEALGRYKAPLLGYLKTALPPESYKSVSATLDMADFDIGNNAFLMNGERTKISRNGPYAPDLQKVLSLRLGKTGAAICAFLSAKDIETKYNFVMRKVQGKLTDVAQKCIDTYGSEFVYRLAHNFGPGGAILFLTTDTDKLVRNCISHEAAYKNDWYGSTVGELLTHFGQTFLVVKQNMQSCHLVYAEKQAARQVAEARKAQAEKQEAARKAKAEAQVAAKAAPQAKPASTVKVAAKTTTAPAAATAAKPQPQAKGSIVPASTGGKPTNPAKIAEKNQKPSRDTVKQLPKKQAALGRSI